MSRLKEQYKKEILPQLKSELKFDNDFAVPRILKIVVNAGIGKLLLAAPKNLENLRAALAKIAGQQPVITRAAKAIAGFKTREGQIVGLRATLRGRRMYDFLDKFINVAMPRTRDFRGLSPRGFDGRGNYNCGIRENIVFPEVVEGGAEGAFGLEITIVTSAKNNEDAYKLLKKFGFPFGAVEDKAPKRARRKAVR